MRVVDSLVESQVAAQWSSRLFGRESISSSIRGVVSSLAESWVAAPLNKSDGSRYLGDLPSMLSRLIWRGASLVDYVTNCEVGLYMRRGSI